MPSETGVWDEIAAHKAKRLTALFADDPARAETFSVGQRGLYFDFSKTHLDAGLLGLFEKLAEERDLAGHSRALFAGEIVNPTEERAAEHAAERGSGSPDAVERAGALRSRMRGLVDAIEAGALGEIDHILHIGIGGSALGPRLLADALGSAEGAYDLSVLSNVDGVAFERAVHGFDPQRTLIAIASKSFTTSETMLNAKSAIAWMEEGGVRDPYGRIVAMTASPDKASEWGVDDSRILPFSETVGGRYSLWSSIAFPAALALGWPAFEELLEGAGAMDRHFQNAPWAENAPVMAAFADLYYAQAKGAQSRALFSYDERLSLLPDYIQQLEMESNGKRVTADGKPLGRPSAPVIWGGVGTDAQHAVFQLLHQGTHLIPVEFVAVAEAGDRQDPAHHEALLINCFAQGAALMRGRESEDEARAYPGDRPSMTVLLERLDPSALGALLAFYEHRTFANAALLGINPFDQFGVELGKEIARELESGEGGEFDPSTETLIDKALGGAWNGDE